METPSPDWFRAHLVAETEAFARVLDRSVTEPGLLSAPVAACPGWDLTALTHHLGESTAGSAARSARATATPG